MVKKKEEADLKKRVVDVTKLSITAIDNLVSESELELMRLENECYFQRSKVLEVMIKLLNQKISILENRGKP